MKRLVLILLAIATVCLIVRTYYKASTMKKEPVFKQEIPIIFEPFERKCRTFTLDKRFHV